MAETTTIRLMAAAKEFNIGKDTLVDFLVSKGFSQDDVQISPTGIPVGQSRQDEERSDRPAQRKP
jgi:translation initiation factor IF-2